MTQRWLKGYNLHIPYTFVPAIGVVKTTPMDRALGRSVNIKSDEARGDFSKAQNEFSNMPVFRDLLADTFYTYYLNEPELIDGKVLPPEYRISQLLLTWMATQPDTNMAKSMTTSSAPASIAAALFSWRAMMSDEAFEAIRKAMQQLQQMKSEIENERSKEHQEQQSDEQQQGAPDEPDDDEQEQQPQAGDDDNDEQDDEQQGGGGDEQEEQEQEQQPQPQQSKADQMQKEYERKADKVEQAIKNMMGNPVTNGAMRDATKDSLKKIEDLSAMAQSWGLDMGQMSVVDVTAIMELYESNREFISKLADLIGRSEIASSSALQRVRESYIGNPTKLNLTQDLSRVLPYEAILLSEMSPHMMRTQQVLDWASQGLLGWVIEAEGMTQGSFVAYVDGSGSMTYYNMDRIIAAKAIAFGLAKVLHDDRFEQRAYVIKTFGSYDDPFITIDENSSMEEIARWSGETHGGGTDFNYCFEDCLEVMDELDKRDILGTDLVFITDGDAVLSEEHRENWKELSKRTGSRLMLVLINEGDTRYDEELERMADLVINVDPEKFANDPEDVIEQLVNIVAMPRKEDNGVI